MQAQLRSERVPRAGAPASTAAFSLIELVVVVSILLVVMVFSLPSLAPAQRRLNALRGDYEKLLSALDRTRFGALTGASDWLLELDCATLGGGFRLGPNDGWKGGAAMIQHRANGYYPGNPAFDEAERDNDALSTTEVFATGRLSTYVRLLDNFGSIDVDKTFKCPSWIKFKHDGTLASNITTGSMIGLWVADERFDPGLLELDAIDGQREWMKPIFVLPTGALHLPYTN